MIDPVTKIIMETSGDYQYMRDDWKLPEELPSLQDAKIIAIDLETCDPNLKKYGPGWAIQDGEIAGISIATDTGIAEYFPIAHVPGPNLDEKTVIAWLKKELETDIPKVFANNYYDCGWLSAYGIWPGGPWYDIQIAAPLLDEHKLSYSLDNLGLEYCNERKDESGLEAAAALMGIAPKDIKSSLYLMSSYDVARYAIQDAVLTLKVWNVLEPMIREEGLWPVFELETELSPVLIKMRHKGVRINAEKRDQLIEELTKREATAKARITELCGREVDVWSAKDIADAYMRMNHDFYYTKASVKKALSQVFELQEKQISDLEGKTVDWLKTMNESPVPQHELASYTYIKSLDLKKLFKDELQFQYEKRQAPVLNAKSARNIVTQLVEKDDFDNWMTRQFLNFLNPSITAKYLDVQDDEVSQHIKAARKWNRAVSAFLNNSFTDMVRNGRIHCCYHQLKRDEGGTITGRFSCANPNLQQVPVRDPEIGVLIRSLFEAEPGKIWGSFDYKAQEPRLLIHYCKLAEDMGMISTTSANALAAQYNIDPMTDSHQATADLITNMKGNILGPTNKIRRQAAKTINLGKAYVMGLKKLALNLGISEEEAKPIVEAYDQGVPHVKAFQKYAAKQAEIRGFVKSILGRKLHFPLWEPKLPFGDNRLVKPETLEHAQALQRDPSNEIWYNRLIRRAATYKAINSIIQSSAADMTKRAMVELYKRDYVPVMQVHDELNFSDLTSMEQVEEIKKIMEEAIPLCIPVVCEAGTGVNWGEAH